jgi:hypothetical protein
MAKRSEGRTAHYALLFPYNPLPIQRRLWARSMAPHSPVLGLGVGVPARQGRRGGCGDITSIQPSIRSACDHELTVGGNGSIARVRFEVSACRRGERRGRRPRIWATSYTPHLGVQLRYSSASEAQRDSSSISLVSAHDKAFDRRRKSSTNLVAFAGFHTNHPAFSMNLNERGRSDDWRKESLESDLGPRRGSGRRPDECSIAAGVTRNMKELSRTSRSCRCTRITFTAPPEVSKRDGSRNKSLWQHRTSDRWKTEGSKSISRRGTP